MFSTIAIVPFTLTCPAPTNEKLFNQEKAARGSSAAVDASLVGLVQKWGRLNMSRAVRPVGGALIAHLSL